MKRIYRYRIYPTKSQGLLIGKTFGCVRFVYNKMLEERKAAWEEHKGDAASLRGRRHTLPAAYKDACPWLREVDSLALANAYLHLQAAYGNFCKKGGRSFPRFKKKHGGKKSYTTNNQKGSVRIEGGRRLRLPKVGEVRIKLHRPLPAGAKVKSATVSMSPSGAYHASLLVELAGEGAPKAAEPRAGRTLSIGCPPGWVYKDSQGGGEKLPASCAALKGRLQEEKKKLKGKKAGGKNFEKQRRKIARLKEKDANRRKDLLHKISRRIANAWDGVAAGEAPGGAGKGTWFGELKKLLAYKLAEQGKKLADAGEPRAGGGMERRKLPGVA
jgi:putative transposase